MKYTQKGSKHDMNKICAATFWHINAVVMYEYSRVVCCIMVYTTHL